MAFRKRTNYGWLGNIHRLTFRSIHIQRIQYNHAVYWFGQFSLFESTISKADTKTHERLRSDTDNTY